MSLGGYKFSGYKCSKGSLSDSDWAILLHKTRLKAFMEANNASNSQWSFNKTSGTYSFEGFGNVIYDIDSDGMNFVSFLKYGSEERYIAIVSMFNQTVNFNQEASGYAYWASSNQYLWSNRTCFHVLSLEEFTDEHFMQTGYVYPTTALSMYPITTIYISSSNEKVNSSSTNTLFKQSTVYFGYAIKEKEIISLTSYSDASPSSANPLILTTILGFDSLTLTDQNDEYNIFCESLNGTNSAYERMTNDYWNTSTYLNQAVLTLKDDGTRYNKSGSFCPLAVDIYVGKARINGTPQIFPFESCPIFSTNGTTPSQITTNNFLSKGSTNIEFLARNSISNYAYLNNYTTYANGNYLLIAIQRQTYPLQCSFYIGWDPSNPNIKSESSWTVYS